MRTVHPEPSPDLDRLSSAVIGAAIEVHTHLGPGYLGQTYEAALAIEFELRGVCFSRQHPIDLAYKGTPIGEGRLDFLVSGKLVVELKAVAAITEVHKAQVMSYLKATGHPLGLLINFNVVMLKDGVKRIVFTKNGN